MMLATVAASGWVANPEAGRRLLARGIAGGGGDATLAIDAASMEREARAGSAGSAAVQALAPTSEVDLSDWLRAGMTEDGVVDAQAVRRCARSLPVDRPIVVDARGHHPRVIEAVLPHLRHAWFFLDDWHPAFVMVCDDAYQMSLSTQLSTTFYCQGQAMSDREINRLVRQMMRRATTYRWLGPGFGRWQEKLYRRIEGVLNLWDRMVDRRERRA